MNEISEKMSEEYIPQMAVVVYSTTKNDSYYLERHKIKNGKMGAGVPLSKECISDVLRAIASHDENLDLGLHGIVPKNILFVNTAIGRTKLVWYNPPTERHLYFVPTLGIPSGKVVVPGMIYVVENDRLNVYSFIGKEPKDKLYCAPYMNVNSNGSVCLGNAKVKKPKDATFYDVMQYWEEMFWKSEFSHILGPNPIEGNLAIVTSECINSGKPFPTNVLKLSSFKLKDLLK